MIAGRLSRAARARLARIRHGATGGSDGGFALIFVMLVTTVIMIAVAATLTITTPNILNAKKDQDSQAASAAAQAGVDDFLAYLKTATGCQITSSVCNAALGASSGNNPTPLAGTDQTFTWHTDSKLTDDYDVRVHSTGTAGGTSRSLVADVALNSPILGFGYYTDYESQSPSFLYSYFDNRQIYLDDADTYDQVDAYDTRGRRISVNSPTTVSWQGPPTSGTNPDPASMCGEHWYAEPAIHSPGRYSYGTDSVWGEDGTVAGYTVMRQASCDVVFTTGMTFDGPIYTRDALLISDQTRGGTGPIFDDPVQSLWGYRSGSASYNTPSVPALPWRQDGNAGGSISRQSPYSPTVATADLQMPKGIGTEGLPDSYCIYTGPTRIHLNGDGTATVTSPETTTRPGESDCYPSGSLAGGIENFTLDYKTLGNGTVYVQDLGDEPSAGWPATGTKSDVAATPANSVFYLSAPAGTVTSPDKSDSVAADDSACSSTVRYRSTASYPCAWTDVVGTSDSGGWTSDSGSKCSTSLAATDRQLFDCDYTGTASGTVAPDAYPSLRSAVQTALSGGTCVSATSAALTTCLTNLVNSKVQVANSGHHPANYGSPASGDHQYVVTSATAGSASQGTPQSLGNGSTPAAPMAGDPLFTSTSTRAQETATQTPVTLTVSRQTYGCVNSSGGLVGSIVKLLSGLLGCLLGSPGWGGSTPQFTVTFTQSRWAITSQPSAVSYFPNTKDVTQYSTGTAGAAGSNGPGDLYVDGNDQGHLSLIAQHDVVVTGDIEDTSAKAKDDAVDIVAGNNVRNYHPVSCTDQTGADIDKTTAGWCPNDITGLYSGASGMESNGVLTSRHPAKQYVNMTTPGARRIDAAIFALSGSFMTDNYNRGDALGDLTVNGGLYQSHRGANGVQWEYQSSDTKRATSGYSLQYHYVDLQHAGLPYTPPVDGASNGEIWTVVSVSSDGSG